VDDLIDGFARSAAREHVRLVIAGMGSALADMRERARRSPVGHRIAFLDDVDDVEKWSLMAGCAAFVLPSKPTPAFVETFCISLVEKMLAGGGPVITTRTGGIPEAVGDTATTIPIESPAAVAAAIDDAVFRVTDDERRSRAERARGHALQFDRLRVFDRLFAGLVPGDDVITLSDAGEDPAPQDVVVVALADRSRLPAASTARRTTEISSRVGAMTTRVTTRSPSRTIPQ
jgi:glycosyltransferase involved in cell wall biosynthesis